MLVRQVAMDDGMEVSPFASRGPSLSATPVSQSKRQRDAEDDYHFALADQVLMKPRTHTSPALNLFNVIQRTPCASVTCSPQRTGVHTPVSGGAMCLTPMGCGGPGGDSSQMLAVRMGVRWASHQRLGPRSNQEDYSLCKCDERGFPHAYFGVFDGHGGKWVSEFCADYLHDNVVSSQHASADPLSALQDGFLRTDAQLLRLAGSAERRKQNDAGSAAVVVMATAETLHVGHAGDCRAILVKRSDPLASWHPDQVTTDGHALSFVELTRDHTAEVRRPHEGGGPLFPEEVERVKRVGGTFDAMGGCVTVGDGENRSLPMTRAFGNLPLKVGPGKDWRRTPAQEQVVTALPSVKSVARRADDLCLVLASDGLFGSVMTSGEVADIARRCLEGPDAGAADIEKQCARKVRLAPRSKACAASYTTSRALSSALPCAYFAHPALRLSWPLVLRATAPTLSRAPTVQLTESALDHFQGSDNVTVVVVSLTSPPPPSTSSQQQQQQSSGMAITPQGFGAMPFHRHRSPVMGCMIGGAFSQSGSSAPEPCDLMRQESWGNVSSDGDKPPQQLPSLTRHSNFSQISLASSRVSSLDSVDTDYASTSPGRPALRGTLRMPFEDAYPYVEGEGGEQDDENELPDTQASVASVDSEDGGSPL